MKSKTPNPISQNIKKYRLLNHMTQEQLADLLDLDTQYYAQLERGERNFTIDKIVRLCTIFHVGIENIIEIEPEYGNDTSMLIEKLSFQMQSLNESQLILLDKFMTEVLPFVK